MFGIELSELFLFLRQTGLALAGAASLWGFVFLVWSRHDHHSQSCVVHEWLGAKLLPLFFAGVATALFAWLALSSVNPALAHEGIVLPVTLGHVALGLETAAPFMLLWGLTLIGGLLFRLFAPRFFQKNLEWFYALQLGFVALLMMLFSWGGEMGREQAFFWGHSLHSILTLGTVLVLDFLFLTSQSSAILKQHVYPLFPAISKVIWVGLGIDFLSVALVFGEAVALTPKFFFMQTVIAVLIINGSLLAGPITRRMVSSVKEGGKKLSGAWERIGDVSGVISISSWGTITLVDSFSNLQLSYLQLLGAYFLLVSVLYLGHALVKRLERQPPAFLAAYGGA
ncbi:MAG: hypothetical protein Q8P12_08045 [bacterium]|nr:hypothetical protein [bacterium]